MTAFRTRGPIHPDAEAQLSAISLRTGPLIHLFAEIEVLVAGWLWKLFGDPNEALRFLSKTTAIGKRIDKLIKLLREQDGRVDDAFIEDLQKVSEYRELRNTLVHGVQCYSGTFASIVTWKGHAHISTQDLDEAIRETNILAIKIFNAYTIQYDSYMDLNFVASQTPPATI